MAATASAMPGQGQTSSSLPCWLKGPKQVECPLLLFSELQLGAESELEQDLFLGFSPTLLLIFPWTCGNVSELLGNEPAPLQTAAFQPAVLQCYATTLAPQIMCSAELLESKGACELGQAPSRDPVSFSGLTIACYCGRLRVVPQ